MIVIRISETADRRQQKIAERHQHATMANLPRIAVLLKHAKAEYRFVAIEPPPGLEIALMEVIVGRTGNLHPGGVWQCHTPTPTLQVIARSATS